MNAERIAYLRQELAAERISWGELHEIQSAADDAGIDQGNADNPDDPMPLEVILDELEALENAVVALWYVPYFPTHRHREDGSDVQAVLDTPPFRVRNEAGAVFFANPTDWEAVDEDDCPPQGIERPFCTDCCEHGRWDSK